MRTITLNDGEKEILLRQDPATEADGGYQKLWVTLQYLLNENTGTIELPDILLERFHDTLLIMETVAGKLG